MQGNCSEPDAATALGLSTRANSLPLKPRQCLLLFPDTLFTIIEDSIWIDNLYLKSHQPRLQPDIQDPAFIRVGLSNFLWERMQADLVLDTPNGQGGVFLTNITFEAPPHPNLLGVSTGFELFQVYLSGMKSTFKHLTLYLVASATCTYAYLRLARHTCVPACVPLPHTGNCTTCPPMHRAQQSAEGVFAASDWTPVMVAVVVLVAKAALVWCAEAVCAGVSSAPFVAPY